MRSLFLALACLTLVVISGCGGNTTGVASNLPAGIAWGTLGGTQQLNFVPVSGSVSMALSGSMGLTTTTTGYAYSRNGLTAFSEYDASNINLPPVTRTFILNADGSSNMELNPTTCDVNPAGTVCWSPDETHLAYAFSTGGQANIFTSLVGAGASRVQLTTTGADPQSPLSWGTNGNIYFENANSIYSVAPDGNGSPVLVTSTSSWYPQISPDSSSLSFISTDRHKLYCRNLGAGTEQVVLDFTLTGETVAGAGWMPDNQTLRYIKFAGQHSFLGRINSLTLAGSEVQMPDTLNPGTLAVPTGSGVPSH